jgi:hypothetical protein
VALHEALPRSAQPLEEGRRLRVRDDLGGSHQRARKEWQPASRPNCMNFML